MHFLKILPQPASVYATTLIKESGDASALSNAPTDLNFKTLALMHEDLSSGLTPPPYEIINDLPPVRITELEQDALEAIMGRKATRAEP